MEKWSAYTRDGVRTEDVLYRGEPIPKGLYALGCEVLVRHADGSFLCMKRAKSKAAFPCRYETTAGGAALFGEDPIACIRRELREETGILADTFLEIGVTVDDRAQTICHNFVCCVDCDRSDVTLQEGETEGFLWLNQTEFLKFIRSDQVIPPQIERFMPYLKTVYSELAD